MFGGHLIGLHGIEFSDDVILSAIVNFAMLEVYSAIAL